MSQSNPPKDVPKMSPCNPRVLFITHDAHRTGAPLVLLEIMRWLKQNTDWDLNILLGGDGSLKNDFLAIARQFELENSLRKPTMQIASRTLKARLMRRVYRYLRNSSEGLSLEQQLPHPNIDLIYSNTVVNGKLLKQLAQLNAPVISHIHEMKYLVEHFGEENWNLVESHTGRFIAVSQAVKRNLLMKGITERKISVIYPPLCGERQIPTEEATTALRKLLNLNRETEVIIGCGAGFWQKGVDLLVRITSILRHQLNRKNLQALWIGGNRDDVDYRRTQFEIHTQNVQDCFQFIPHVNNPLDYINLANVFCMTSREDSFPLVNLEASLLKKPIVCFRQGGGTTEFLGDNCGLTAEYPDCFEFAKRIEFLLENRSAAKNFANAANEKVNTFFHRDKIACHIKDEILAFLNTQNSIDPQSKL
jgi:glycosyltransferase involved in cell wall biosynthesis